MNAPVARVSEIQEIDEAIESFLKTDQMLSGVDPELVPHVAEQRREIAESIARLEDRKTEIEEQRNPLSRPRFSFEDPQSSTETLDELWAKTLQAFEDLKALLMAFPQDADTKDGLQSLIDGCPDPSSPSDLSAIVEWMQDVHDFIGGIPEALQIEHRSALDQLLAALEKLLTEVQAFTDKLIESRPAAAAVEVMPFDLSNQNGHIPDTITKLIYSLSLLPDDHPGRPDLIARADEHLKGIVHNIFQRIEYYLELEEEIDANDWFYLKNNAIAVRDQINLFESITKDNVFEDEIEERMNEEIAMMELLTGERGLDEQDPVTQLAEMNLEVLGLDKTYFQELAPTERAEQEDTQVQILQILADLGDSEPETQRPQFRGLIREWHHLHPTLRKPLKRLRHFLVGSEFEQAVVTIRNTSPSLDIDKSKSIAERLQNCEALHFQKPVGHYLTEGYDYIQACWSSYQKHQRDLSLLISELKMTPDGKLVADALEARISRLVDLADLNAPKEMLEDLTTKVTALSNKPWPISAELEQLDQREFKPYQDYLLQGQEADIQGRYQDFSLIMRMLKLLNADYHRRINGNMNHRGSVLLSDVRESEENRAHSKMEPFLRLLKEPKNDRLRRKVAKIFVIESKERFFHLQQDFRAAVENGDISRNWIKAFSFVLNDCYRKSDEVSFPMIFQHRFAFDFVLHTLGAIFSDMPDAKPELIRDAGLKCADYLEKRFGKEVSDLKSNLIRMKGLKTFQGAASEHFEIDPSLDTESLEDQIMLSMAEASKAA